MDESSALYQRQIMGWPTVWRYTCCNNTMTPPWFSVELPAPTTDMIEVSICADEPTNNEDTPIELLEIYQCIVVQ